MRLHVWVAAVCGAFFSLSFLAACEPSAAGDGVTMRTLGYGPLPDQRADIYELTDVSVPAPAAATPGRKPVALLIHGGGWTAGSRSEFADLARWAARQGMLPVSIDYRLVQTAQWPAQADDVERAVWWLRENAQALHADPDRIVAIGGSAGAHLAAWLGTTNHVNANGTPSRVTAVVSLWGPWDLTSTNVREDGRNMIAALVGTQGPGAASPIFRIDAQSAPALLIHGTKDELVPPDQSTRACIALQKVHVDCELMLLEGEGHGLTTRNADPMPMLERMKAFMGKHL